MTSVPPSSPDPTSDPEVITEAAVLRALAHPLRLRLLGLLRLYGPSTATRLAERCSQSPALVSYHLRALAGGGAIVDAEADDLVGMTVHGRDRWWKAARRSTLTALPPDDESGSAAAHEEYEAAVLAVYTQRAQGWLDVQPVWPREWRAASTFSDVPLRLTADETRRLSDDMMALLAGYRRHDPSVDADAPAGSMVVAAQFLVFPEPDQEVPAEPRA